MGFMWGLRWIPVFLAPFVGFYSALFISLLTLSFAERFCPSDLIVSGLCTAPWYGGVWDAATMLGSALAAASVVLLPTLLAPKKRLVVATAFYILEAAAALLMSVPSGGLTAILTPAVNVALVAGALTLLAVRWVLFERPIQTP